MSKENVGQRVKNNIYFHNPDLDFYFQAVPLNYQTFGGATVGESFYAASRIDEKNLESWVQEWTAVAARVEAQGAAAVKKGHRVSARSAYLRASTYYRTALFTVSMHDSRFRLLSDKVVACFRQFAQLCDWPIEPVAIPFEGKTLPAYLMRPNDSGARRPTLIMIHGGESYTEEAYYWGGADGIARGYNVLLVDMPGQGMTPFDGMHQRHDVEAPMKAVVDYLITRSEVDADRIAIYGVSWGGYIVVRAVAFEHRIKACVASAPIIDAHQWLIDGEPAALQRAPKFLTNSIAQLGTFLNPVQQIAYEKWFEWEVGAPAKVGEILDMFKPYKVPVEQIVCPMLCMVGEGEDRTFHIQTHACYDALQSPKALREFTVEEGADAHCQGNNLLLGHQVVYDWLDEVFGWNNHSSRSRRQI